MRLPMQPGFFADLEKVKKKCMPTSRRGDQINVVLFNDLLGYKIDELPSFDDGQDLKKVVLLMQLHDLTVPFLRRKVQSAD